MHLVRAKYFMGDRLELIGDDDRLVGFAGVLALRLLAERTGLRAGLSRAMARRGFDPVYHCGQLGEGERSTSVAHD